MADMPVNIIGMVGPGQGIKVHNRPPKLAEDLNRAQADKLKDGGGLAANVLNRRYGERGEIRGALEYMLDAATNTNVNRCSRQELIEIDVIPSIARLARDNNPRYWQIREDTIQQYLRLKKQRQVDRAGANWHFRLPELALQKCPKLDTFDPASGAAFFEWKDVTSKQLDRHATTSAHRLELVKTLINQRYLALVGHCTEPEEIFDILEHKIPPKAEICRYLEDRIALGGNSVSKQGADETSLYRKAESIQLLLTQLALVEPDYDISKSCVDACLLSFGSSAGSHMEQARLTSAWYDLKRESNQFLSIALDMWLETFKSALGSASATRVRAEKLALVDAAVVKSGGTSRQGRQESRQGWQGGREGSSRPASAPPSAPPTPPPPSHRATTPPAKTKSSTRRTQTEAKTGGKCFGCDNPQGRCVPLFSCPVITSWREKSTRIPQDRCKLCLHIKDGDRHKFSQTENKAVCHWKIARGKSSNTCCTHNVSKYICKPCFDGEQEKRVRFTSSQKRMSMRQVFSAQNQACTSVHLPTVYQQREKVVVCGPDGQDREALLVYDTGADHSMVSPELASCDTSENTRMAHGVTIIGSLASQEFDLPIVRLNIRSVVDEVPYATGLNLAVKELTGERQDPVWHQMPLDLDLKDPITEDDLGLPIILLGIDYISLHPTLCEGPHVHHLPGLVYFKSSFTEKVLPVGRISQMRDATTEDEQLAHTRRAQLSKVGIQTKVQDMKQDSVESEKKIHDVQQKEKESKTPHQIQDFIAQDDEQRAESRIKRRQELKQDQDGAQGMDEEKSLGQRKDKPLIMLSPGDQDVEGNFCAPLSSLPAIKALTHDVMMNEIKECWGPVEQSAAVSNVSKLGCMSCSAVPQALLDKQDISFFC